MLSSWHLLWQDSRKLQIILYGSNYVIGQVILYYVLQHATDGIYPQFNRSPSLLLHFVLTRAVRCEQTFVILNCDKESF